MMLTIIIGAIAQSMIVFGISFVVGVIICCLYVKSQLRLEIWDSRERVKDEQYVATLIAGGYPVKKGDYK